MLETKNIESYELNIDAGNMPFLLVLSNDGIRYQVKIPNIYSISMLNEYIANQIAKKVNILTPDGVFLRFSLNDMARISILLQETHRYKQNTFQDDYKDFTNINGEMVLFGVKWLEEIEVKFADNEELYEYLDCCISDNFYSIFSFDLLLYNEDRHNKNIMICSNSNQEFELYLIDHDRIFNSNKDLNELNRIKDIFECFQNKNEDIRYLAQYITNSSQKNKILEYSKNYKNIKEEDINNILDTFSKNCPPDILKFKDVRDEISSFILYRIEKIESACKINLEKGLCYA